MQANIIQLPAAGPYLGSNSIRLPATLARLRSFPRSLSLRVSFGCMQVYPLWGVYKSGENFLHFWQQCCCFAGPFASALWCRVRRCYARLFGSDPGQLPFISYGRTWLTVAAGCLPAVLILQLLLFPGYVSPWPLVLRVDACRRMCGRILL